MKSIGQKSLREWKLKRMVNRKGMQPQLAPRIFGMYIKYV